MFLSDFRNLNKQLKCKTYPMPKINEMLLKLEGYQYAMSPDLNMGYYKILLTEDTSNLCVIILLWHTPGTMYKSIHLYRIKYCCREYTSKPVTNRFNKK